LLLLVLSYNFITISKTQGLPFIDSPMLFFIINTMKRDD